ncbi:MAG: GNAT family N-acetyltransferase [Chloroflexota bacterium]
MALIVAQVRADNGDADLGTVAELDNHYAHLEHADLPRDCALVELDGVEVGYGRASWEETITGDLEVQCIINIAPAGRGRGAEQLLLRHALARAEELIGEIGGDRPTRLAAYVVDRDAALRATMEAAGFHKVRQSASLVRPTFDDIPDLPLPDGFEIRPIDPLDRTMHRRVFDASTRAFANSHGEIAQTENQFQGFLEQPTFDPTLWRVAFRGEDIAGQILNYMGETAPDGSRTGFTEGISVQPEFRRRGLARALLAESLRAVRDAGATQAVLGVDMQNPNQARDLYESMGYRIVSITHEYQLGPFPPGARPQLVPEAWQ